MPQYDSKLGVWKPKHEYAVIPNAPRGKEIYEGPDRGALEQMAEAGLIDPQTGEIRSYLGQDIRQNIEMRQIARQFGFESVEEYLTKWHGWTPEKFSNEEKKSTSETSHADLPTKPEGKFMGGGEEMIPGGKQHRYGGFELPADAANAPRLDK